jgi:hypothetical protein
VGELRVVARVLEGDDVGVTHVGDQRLAARVDDHGRRAERDPGIVRGGT